MSWLASFFVAFVTAVAAAISSGFAADLSVSWYRITSREGASGYFVVGMGLLGFLGGAVVGLVVSRIVAGGPSPGLAKALGLSLGAVLAVVGSIAGVARALADVPPEVDGEPLWLVVEVRFPPDRWASAAELPADAVLRLGACGRLDRTVRVQRDGLLFADDARREEGGWVVPGIVELFTSRGLRILDVVLEGNSAAGFIVPVPAHPGAREREWSDWLPRPRPDGGPAATPLTYRFRVVKRSEPVRSETFGPFEVSTVCSYLYRTAHRTRLPLAARSGFVVRHRGEAAVVEAAAGSGGGAGRRLTRFETVMAVAGPRPALLVEASGEDSPGGTYLLVSEGDSVRSLHVGGVEAVAGVARVADGASGSPPRDLGWFDRVSLAREGVYLVGPAAVVDTRRLSVHRFEVPYEVTLIPSVPPLGLSPDERSLVRFAYADGSEEAPILAVTDFVKGTSATVPIDRARTPFAGLEELGPAWLDRHFAWERGSDGIDRLSERPGLAAPAPGE